MAHSLVDSYGQAAVHRAWRARGPSYGQPIVLMPPQAVEALHRPQRTMVRRREGDTTSATFARTTGMPGADRAPAPVTEWDTTDATEPTAERETPQGMPARFRGIGRGY